MAFKCHLGDNGYAWPSNIRICKLAGISKATLRKSIARLQKAGHINRQPTEGGSWRTYVLTTVEGGKAVRGRPKALVAPKPAIIAPRPANDAPSPNPALPENPGAEPEVDFGILTDSTDEEFFAE